MKHIIFVILIGFFLACNSPKNEKLVSPDSGIETTWTYLVSGPRKHDIDTTTYDILNFSLEDSVYSIDYIYHTIFEHHDEFQNDTFDLSFDAKKYFGEPPELRLVDEMNVWFQDKQYTVLKFFYEIPSCDDEEMQYFLEPSLGLLISKSAAWGGYNRMIDNGDPEEVDDIFYVIEMIMFDCEFFHD